tara:strand:+ start:390 stop:1070 length:681 start_codon:yes stop_codon:yes gene_type:complete
MKRRSPIKSTPIGFLCINKVMNSVIGKVLTKARQRGAIAAKRVADPSKYKRINQEAQAKFYKDHKEQVLQWNREQRESNYDRYLERTRDRRKVRRATDTTYTIKERLRARLRNALLRKRKRKLVPTMELLGCSPSTLDDLIQLRPGCDVDHIFPFERYSMDTRSDQQRVMHFSNLQCLTSNENNWKSAKLPTKAMAAKVERWAWPDGVTEDMLPDIYPGWATALRK